VRGKAPTVTQETTAPPATLSAPQLRTLPLTEQKFKAALPSLPCALLSAAQLKARPAGRSPWHTSGWGDTDNVSLLGLAPREVRV